MAKAKKNEKVSGKKGKAEGKKTAAPQVERKVIPVMKREDFLDVYKKALEKQGVEVGSKTAADRMMKALEKAIISIVSKGKRVMFCNNLIKAEMTPLRVYPVNPMSPNNETLAFPHPRATWVVNLDKKNIKGNTSGKKFISVDGEEYDLAGLINFLQKSCTNK